MVLQCATMFWVGCPGSFALFAELIEDKRYYLKAIFIEVNPFENNMSPLAKLSQIQMIQRTVKDN